MTILTMQQFLKNPSGKSSAVFARRDLIIANLEMRFAKLYHSRKKAFKLEMFSDKGTYIFKFKIPSEKFNTLVYDTVIQFIPIGNSNGDLTLNNYALKVFSNSPAMMFTYTYVFNNNGMIVDFLIDKCSEKSLKEKPEIKNPQEMFGFEKSIYFSLLYIKELGYNVKSNIKTNNFIIEKIKKDIMTAEEKFEEYNKHKLGLNKEEDKFNKLNDKSDYGKYKKAVKKKTGETKLDFKRKRHRRYKKKF